MQAATSWFMYAYALEDPLSDVDVTFYNNAHGSKPVYVVHRSHYTQDLPSDVKIWDLMNFEVFLFLFFPQSFLLLFLSTLQCHIT